MPWAVTFTDVYSARAVGTPMDTPLHPSQLYESFAAFLIFFFLVWLAPRKRFHGQVTLAYVALYSVVRFTLEFWRGDPDRGSWFGGVVSTSQIDRGRPACWPSRSLLPRLRAAQAVAAAQLGLTARNPSGDRAARARRRTTRPRASGSTRGWPDGCPRSPGPGSRR